MGTQRADKRAEKSRERRDDKNREDVIEVWSLTLLLLLLPHSLPPITLHDNNPIWCPLCLSASASAAAAAGCASLIPKKDFQHEQAAAAPHTLYYLPRFCPFLYIHPTSQALKENAASFSSGGPLEQLQV